MFFKLFSALFVQRLSHGTQPDNPDKGALCIIKAIEADNPPFLLLLGTDAVRFAETVMSDRQKEYADWREFSLICAKIICPVVAFPFPNFH